MPKINRKHSLLLILFVVLIIAFLTGPMISTGPYTTDTTAVYQPPSEAHLLGTDHLGRDVLSRVLSAGTFGIGIAIVSALFALSLGAFLGAISGYVGGWWDSVFMRVFDVWQSVPGILLGLFIMTVFGQGLLPLLSVISLSFVPMYARMVRSELLPERRSHLVEAARLSNIPEWKILFVYLLPTHMTAAVAYMPIQAAFAIGMTAGLGFIGLGMKPPAPEWGSMISEGMSDLVFLGIWWTSLPAGILLGLTSFLLFKGGDWLSDRFNKADVDSAWTRWISLKRETEGAQVESRSIHIKGLTVTYVKEGEPVPALRGIDVTMNPREITAVIGESGSGKTTLAKALLGALPRSARVTYDMSDLPERIAFIQQEAVASLHPLIAVGEQVTDVVFSRKRAAGQRVLRSTARGEIHSHFESLGLKPSTEIYRRFPHQLSGGQAQRVSLARALGMGAGLLVADEPTSQLDLVTQAEAVRLIYSLTKEHNICTLFITHRLPLVAEVADQVLVLRDGKVVEHGPVVDVWSDPKHEYTRMLLRDM